MQRRKMRGAWAHLALRGALMLSLLSTHGFAQNASDKAAAETLFDEGRTLLDQGQTEQACEKFAASQRLDPAPGTQLNLADCYERVGRVASAWINFREALALAKNAGDKNRARIAQDRATKLEPKLSRLTIVVPDAVRSLSGLRITRDGAAVDAALWGSAVPVDPGKHTLVAEAPGHQAASLDFEIGEADKQKTIEIPPLAEASAAPAAAAPAAPPPAPAPAQPALKVEPKSSSQRTWAAADR